MANKTKKDTLTAFKLPVSDLKGLQELARQQDRTVSQLLRAAVRAIIDTPTAS